MWEIFDTFSKWKRIIEFNKIIIKKNHRIVRYIIFISYSKKFDFVEDLNYMFRQRKSYVQYLYLLQQKKTIVMYYTLFSMNEIQKYGPLTKNINSNICLTIYKEFLKAIPRVQVVALKSISKAFQCSITFDEWLATDDASCRVPSPTPYLQAARPRL